MDKDSPSSSLMRCILSTPKQESEYCKHMSIFQTIVRCGNEAHKSILGGRNMKLVSEASVRRLKLQTKATWATIKRSMNQ